jgi:hypothetical protein
MGIPATCIPTILRLCARSLVGTRRCFPKEIICIRKGNYWTWFRNSKVPVPVCNIQIYISHFIRFQFPPSQKIKREDTTSKDLEGMI